MNYRKIDVNKVGDVTVVRFKARKLVGEDNIFELGQELFRLVELDGVRKLLLNFDGVTYIASSVLGKLITLRKKMKDYGDILKLSNIRSDIYETFVTTRLNKLFDIEKDEADALTAF